MIGLCQNWCRIDTVPGKSFEPSHLIEETCNMVNLAEVAETLNRQIQHVIHAEL